MIARHPYQLCKARFEDLESQFEMSRGFSDIAGQDQPIARMTGNTVERAPIDFMAEMKIADGVQFHARRTIEYRFTYPLRSAIAAAPRSSLPALSSAGG